MAEARASSSQSDVSHCVDSNLDLSDLLSLSPGGTKLNATSIYCPRCPSLVLRPGVGLYVNDVPRALPEMEIHLKGHNVDSLLISSYQHFWRVDDIFAFENVGYTNTVDGRYKYLICADCECGPLGVQVIEDANDGNKAPFSYLSVARVAHR